MEGNKMKRILKILAIVTAGIVGALAVLFLLFYLLTIGEYAVAETVAQDSSIPHLTIDGVTYHAETFGDPENPVVIALHGGPGGDYRSILSLQALSDRYFVVFFEQRGAGLSPRVNPEEITLASALADLDSIVDYYGTGEKVNLVGHSWGAMLTSAYLGQDPYTPPIKDAEGNILPGSINSIETVTLGGVVQAITIRGADPTKPVLLHLHGGH